MHPYDKVLTPKLLGAVREGLKNSPAAISMIDMCLASPSPGGMLAALLRAYGLGKYLYDAVEKVFPTPLLQYGDINVDLTEQDINTAYTKAMDRYAVLGTAHCIKEMYTLGFHCGYLYGLLISDFPIESIPPSTMYVYKVNVLTSELLAKSNLFTEEVTRVILKISDTLRSVAKEHNSKEEQGPTDTIT